MKHYFCGLLKFSKFCVNLENIDDLIPFFVTPSDAFINNATVQCFRRKRLDVAHQVEVKVYSFQECLDECMRRYNRDCQSVEYSSRFQSCRFSSQSSGVAKPNLVDDESYDYYEFKWSKYSSTWVMDILHLFTLNEGTSDIDRLDNAKKRG